MDVLLRVIHGTHFQNGWTQNLDMILYFVALMLFHHYIYLFTYVSLLTHFCHFIIYSVFSPFFFYFFILFLALFAARAIHLFAKSSARFLSFAAFLLFYCFGIFYRRIEVSLSMCEISFDLLIIFVNHDEFMRAGVI